MATMEARSLVVAGVTRTYQLYVPDAAVGQASPVAFSFHAEGGDGAGQANVSQLNALADTADGEFIVVYPDSNPATPGTWTVGKNGTDVPFVSAILAALVTEGLANGDVYLTGYSKGGDLVNGCAALTGVRGVGIVANDSNQATWLESPKPTGPIGAVIVHGLVDPVSPYEPGKNHTGGQVQGARQTALNWVGFNKLDPNASVVTQFSNYSTEEWADSAGNVWVTLISVTDGGHYWFGGGQVGTSGKLGPTCPATPVVSDELVNRLP